MELAALVLVVLPASAQRTHTVAPPTAQVSVDIDLLPRPRIVDAAGAPDADHVSLQAAIDAARRGDRLLVRDGAYGRVEIVGKGLTIQADSTDRCTLEGLTVRDLPPGQSVVVRGFFLHRANVAPEAALAVVDCAGSVWFEDLDTTFYRALTLFIEDADSVVLTDCNLEAAIVPAAGPMVIARRSTTFLFDTVLRPNDPQTCIQLDDGFLGLYGSAVSSCDFCTPGPAIHLVGTDPLVEIHASPELDGGIRTDAGTVQHVSGQARSHRLPAPLYDDGTMAVQIVGRAGDVVTVFAAPLPARGLRVPGTVGPRLLGGGLQTVFSGTLTSTQLAFELPLGDLPPGLVTSVYSQALFVNASTNESVRSEPTVTMLLDAGTRRPQHFVSDVASWQASPTDSVAFGASVAAAGDVNGDGFDDVILGDPGFDYSFGTGERYRGRVQVHHGSAGALNPMPAWIRAGQDQWSASYPGGFGALVGGAGDVNGDGFDDVFVTEPERGRFWVFYGSSSGIVDAGATVISDQDQPFDFRGILCAPGDVNGDGYADLWVSMLCHTTRGDCHQVSGASMDRYGFLYHGSAGGLLPTPAWVHVQPVSYAGSVERAGDVNGDGYADLLFGWWTIGIPGDPDHVSLFLGGPGTPTLAWTYQPTGFEWDFTFCSGDVDGDGYDDVVIGGSEDELYLMRGGATPSSVPAQVLRTPFNLFGHELRSLGDVDGDGHADVAVATSRWSVLRGSTAGLSASPSWDRAWTSDSDLASAGDVDGDGQTELLFGSYDTNLDDGIDGGTVELLPTIP